MAESSAGAESPNVLSTDEEHCPICKHSYTRPVLLEPCLCVVCEPCLAQEMEKLSAKDASISTVSDACPVCSGVLHLPEGGTSGMTSANFVSQLQAKDQLQPHCGSCQDEVNKVIATVFCDDCKEYLCSDCDKMFHCRLKKHKPVAVSSLAEVSSAESACPLHPPQHQEYWCCDTAVCPKCLISDHNGHAHKPLEEQRATMTSSLCTWLSRADQESGKAAAALKQLTGRVEQLRQRRSAALLSIDDVQRQVIEQISDKVNTEFTTIRQEASDKWDLELHLTESSMQQAELELKQLQHSSRRVNQLLKAASHSELVVASRSLEHNSPCFSTESVQLSTLPDESKVAADSFLVDFFSRMQQTRSRDDINIVSSALVDRASQATPPLSHISMQTEDVTGTKQKKSRSVAMQVPGDFAAEVKASFANISEVLRTEVKKKGRISKYPAKEKRTVLCGQWYRSAVRYANDHIHSGHPGPVRHSPWNKTDYVVCTINAAEKMRVVFEAHPGQPIPQWRCTVDHCPEIFIFSELICASWQTFQAMPNSEKNWIYSIREYDSCAAKHYIVRRENGKIIAKGEGMQPSVGDMIRSHNLNDYDKLVCIDSSLGK